MKWTIRALYAAVAVVLIASCGGPPAGRIDRLYRSLDESLPRIAPSVLAGRRVVIDPGHGGYYSGTVGQDSLKESSVNLGVALYLWGLLREAGADVYLTRSSDRDFLTPADSSLASDLRARVAIADSIHPDVFLSIHHNAQPHRDPNVNVVETYYRTGDPASLELAFAIHRHLVRNLGIASGEVRQGNYLVLRENDVPSVLGESSYLTQPAVEKRLKLSDVQRLEAESYFLGLLDYFSRGLAHTRFVSPPDSIVNTVPTLIAHAWDDGGGGIDIGTIDFRINGNRVVPVVRRIAGDTTEIRVRLPADAPNGSFRARLTVRNAGGNTSPIHTIRFQIRHPPATAVVRTDPSTTTTRPGSDIWVRARLLDRRGIAVADGTPVVARVGGKEISRGVTTGGTFAFVARVPKSGVFEITLRSDGQTFTSKAPTPTATASGGWKARRVIDRITHQPVHGARATIGAPARGAPGVVFVPAGQAAIVHAPGYQPFVLTAGAPDTLQLDPWFGGAIVGKRFVLDPEGGRNAGTGPLGLESSWVNLRVGQMLAEYLRRAGAIVKITRDDEAVKTPEDIARSTNAWGADRYIEIRHRALPPDSADGLRVMYFPGSRNGSQMARDVGTAAAEILGVPFLGIVSAVTYPLQQTACPAIILSFPSIASRAEELRLDQPAYQRTQAWSAFTGILEHFGVTGGAVIELLPSSPASAVLVVLDDTFSLRVESRAMRMRHIPPGNHVLELRSEHKCTRESFVAADGDTIRVFTRSGTSMRLR